MSDDEFLTKFEQRLLDRADWTHEAHVRMAWLYVARSATYKAARSKVRSGIKKLNSAFQARSMAPCGATPPAESVAEPVEEAKPISFHETITTAFVRLIASRVRPGEKFHHLPHPQPGPLRPQAPRFDDALLEGSAVCRRGEGEVRPTGPGTAAEAVARSRVKRGAGRS